LLFSFAELRQGWMADWVQKEPKLHYASSGGCMIHPPPEMLTI